MVLWLRDPATFQLDRKNNSVPLKSCKSNSIHCLKSSLSPNRLQTKLQNHKQNLPCANCGSDFYNSSTFLSIHHVLIFVLISMKQWLAFKTKYVMFLRRLLSKMLTFLFDMKIKHSIKKTELYQRRQKNLICFSLQGLQFAQTFSRKWRRYDLGEPHLWWISETGHGSLDWHPLCPAAEARQVDTTHCT